MMCNNVTKKDNILNKCATDAMAGLSTGYVQNTSAKLEKKIKKRKVKKNIL